MHYGAYLSCCCCWYWAISWFICKGSSEAVILVSRTGGGESGEVSLGEEGFWIGVFEEGDVVTRVAGVEWVSLAVKNSPLFLYSKFWVSSDIACVKRSAVGKPSGWVDIYF